MIAVLVRWLAGLRVRIAVLVVGGLLLAAFGFYGLLYWLFDRVLWKAAYLARLHGVPDLNGKYLVTVLSSHEGHATTHNGSASIVQSWSHLVVRIEFEESSSRSTGGWLSSAPGAGVILVYAYANTPRGAAPPDLNQHDGTASVIFDASRCASGSYYTGRGRTTYGEVTFEPESPT